MKKIVRLIVDENGNSLVENIIVLPMVFIIIIAMILFSFVMHDKATLEGAATRGTIFAAHLISDPNYYDILSSSGNDNGSLDTSISDASMLSFSQYGVNYHPYRFLINEESSIQNKTVSMVKDIIDKTRIPWRTIDIDSIKCEDDNHFFYHNVKVKISATYPLPAMLKNFGLPTEIKYDIEAISAVTDADDFIRNADLVVDIIVRIDNATGNHLSEAKKKIEQLASKLVDFVKVN